MSTEILLLSSAGFIITLLITMIAWLRREKTKVEGDMRRSVEALRQDITNAQIQFVNERDRVDAAHKSQIVEIKEQSSKERLDRMDVRLGHGSETMISITKSLQEIQNNMHEDKLVFSKLVVEMRAQYTSNHSCEAYRTDFAKELKCLHETLHNIDSKVEKTMMHVDASMVSVRDLVSKLVDRLELTKPIALANSRN